MWLVLLPATSPAAARAQTSTTEPPVATRRGPVEIRDEQLLAQPRLTLPAVSPATVPPGRWAFRLGLLWSNSFSWTQDVPGESPAERSFLIDGEALTLDATVRRGLTPRVDVGVRLPFRWRGGGALDGLIDAWHRLLGAEDANRPDFLENAFRVEGRLSDGSPFSWSDRAGSSVGDLEMEARWRFLAGAGDAPSAALVARLSLPTGVEPFSGNGVGAGGQVVLDAPLGRAFDLYAGAGLTVQDPGAVHGIEYEASRAHGFVALEWRPWRRVSLLAQTNAASRLVANVDRYPGTHWLVDVAARIDVGQRTRLDVGFTENIKSQQATTDFALHFGLTLRP